MINIYCPRCRTEYHTDASNAGKSIACTNCGLTFEIPGAVAIPVGVPLPKSLRTTPLKRSHRLRWTILGVAGAVILVALPWLGIWWRDSNSGEPTRQSVRPSSVAATEPDNSSLAPSNPEWVLVGVEDTKRGNQTRAPRSVTKSPLVVETRPLWPRPETGSRVQPDAGNEGHGELTVDNGTSNDAVVRLVASSTSETVRWFYVQASETVHVGQIPPGIYDLLFTAGNNWNRNENKFENSPSYSAFDGDFSFEEDERGHVSRTVTLHPVPLGNVTVRTISRQEFLKGVVPKEFDTALPGPAH